MFMIVKLQQIFQKFASELTGFAEEATNTAFVMQQWRHLVLSAFPATDVDPRRTNKSAELGRINGHCFE